MQEVLPGLPDTRTEQQQVKLHAAGVRRRTSLLKFYIHDSAAYFRLELIGELTEIDIAELTGCWCTAKSSIAARKLALDVRQLKAVDEAGRQWLSSMIRDGACYITGRNRSGAYVVCPDWRPGGSDSNRGDYGSKFLLALVRFLSSMRQCIAGVDTRTQTSTVNADSVRVTGL
jgi:hypothetical protein